MKINIVVTMLFAALTTLDIHSMSNHIRTGIKATAIAYASLTTATWLQYEYDKNCYPTDAQIHPEEHKAFKERFSVHRPCNNLKVVRLPDDAPGIAHVTMHRNNCVLALTQDFHYRLSDHKKDFVLAHEETHYSQNHQDLLVKTVSPVIGTAWALKNMPFLKSRTGQLSLCLLSLCTASLTALHTIRVCEKEADTLHKTPEQLLTALMYEFGESIPTKTGAFLSDNDRHSKHSQTYTLQTWFTSLLNDPTHADAQVTTQYLADQLEKQITNPTESDTPRSLDACKTALSFYLDEKIISEITASGYMPDSFYHSNSCPLIKKRVDYLIALLATYQALTPLDVLSEPVHN